MTESTGFSKAIVLLTCIKDDDGAILTAPFLDVCREVVVVVEKFGTAFTLIRDDINGNISRLAKKAAQDAVKYKRLFSIIEDDVAAGTHTSSSSCTKGLLWLKRAMEFVVALLADLHDNPDGTVYEAAMRSYKQYLKPYHGWIASSAFTVAIQFVPSRKSFFEPLGGAKDSQQMYLDLKRMVDLFSPILTEVHQFLVDHGLDDPTKV